MQLLHDPAAVEISRALTHGQAQGNFLNVLRLGPESLVALSHETYYTTRELRT